MLWRWLQQYNEHLNWHLGIRKIILLSIEEDFTSSNQVGRPWMKKMILFIFQKDPSWLQSNPEESCQPLTTGQFETEEWTHKHRVFIEDWFGFYLHEASGPPSYKIKIHRLNYNKRDDNVDGWWRMSRPPLMKMMGSVSALVEGLWPGS